jgi:hypothetical protein
MEIIMKRILMLSAFFSCMIIGRPVGEEDINASLSLFDPGVIPVHDQGTDPNLHMREMLRAKKKYFYTGCAIGFGLGCFITGFPPVHCYNKDRLSIIENISEFNGYACAYNAELAHLNAKYVPLVERFFPFNKKPVKLKDYHSALSLTTESGIVSSGVLLWGVSNIFTGFCLPHGIQFLGGIPEAMVGTVQAKMDVREKVLSLLQGTAVGGLVGATTAFAGLLVYAGYKKIVGR